jgi:hypothetical protein
MFGMAAMKIDPSSVAGQQAAQQQRETRPDLVEMQQYCSQLTAGNLPPNYNPDVNMQGYQHATTNPHIDSDPDSDLDTSSDDALFSDDDYASSSSDWESGSDSDVEYVSKDAWDRMNWEQYKDGALPMGPDMALGGTRKPLSLDGDDLWQETDHEDGRVFTGYWTDPNTGVLFKMYQDPLPPPNVQEGGYSEESLKGTHPKLVFLSGNVDPNRKHVPKKEHEAAMPGIADGPSFAGEQLLNTGQRNEARYRVARDIFMYRHGETPGDRAPEMDQYPNGFVGYQMMFRPKPWMGVTYRGQESRWVTGPDPQTPSGKQLQTVQSKVLLNQNPARQKAGRIAPIALPVGRGVEPSRVEDRNPENLRRGNDDERYYQKDIPGGGRRAERGNEYKPHTQRGVSAADGRTGGLQTPVSRRAKNKPDVRMTQRESTSGHQYQTGIGAGGNSTIVNRRSRHLKSVRPGQKESLGAGPRTAPLDLADQVHTGVHHARPSRVASMKEGLGDPRGLNLRLENPGPQRRACNKPDVPMTQKESLAQPGRTAPTQGDRLVTMRHAPVKPDVRMTQREGTSGAVRSVIDAIWRKGFGDRAHHARGERESRRNDANTGKYARVGSSALPNQQIVHPGPDRCCFKRYQPEQGENVGKDVHRPQIGAHTRPGRSDKTYFRRDGQRGTRVPTHLGQQSGLMYDAQSDMVASDIDDECAWYT